MWFWGSAAGWLPSNTSRACERNRIGNHPYPPMTSLRDLPSIEQLLQLSHRLINEYGRPLTLGALRSTLDEARARFKAKPEAGLPSMDVILSQAESHLTAWTASTL